MRILHDSAPLAVPPSDGPGHPENCFRLWPWRARLRRAALVLCGLGLPGLARAQAPAWPVPDAALCAEFRIDARPRESEAGVLLFLPDGGLLPGRYPVVDVRDAAGNPLPSQLIWHNPSEGLALACGVPAAGDRVRVFVRGMATAPARPPAVLKPGLLLCTRPGEATLPAAQRLAAGWPPGADCRVRAVPYIGHRENPLGPDDNYISWYSGWFRLEREETIYFGTVSDEGSELQLDGRPVASWPGLHTRQEGAQGQFGRNVALTAGWHRLDYFHFEAQGAQEMMAVFRRGRDGSLPEQIPTEFFAHSGSASLESLAYRDGRRAAWVDGHQQAASYLWLGEVPVNQYRLRAETGSDEAGLACAWEFAGGQTLQGRTCTWLVAGEAPCPVTLVTSNRAGLARLSFPLFSGSPPRPAAVGNTHVRLDYRQTFLGMVQAVPSGREPGADWAPELWTILAGVLEPYRGGPIVQPLFERGERVIRRLPAAERWVLEDRLIESLRARSDVAPLQAWLRRLEEGERDRVRRFEWRAERVTAWLYDAGDVAAARREALLLREGLSDPDEIQIALIRLGDVERFSGNPDAAARQYGEAQERYRARNRPGAHAPTAALFESSDVPASPAGVPPGTRTTPPRMPGRAALPRVRTEDWKAYAVRDAAFLATVRSYLSQDAVADAFAEMRQWERQSPLAKLSGDYPLAEAQLYVRVGDDRRALRTLQAYRQGVDLTGALPDAMLLELQCLLRLQRREEARVLADEIIKRLPGHPAAVQARETLARLPAAAKEGPHEADAAARE